jgi:Pyruvate/2-oxoacid:ferredoxin oxidoreductase gamma subunit
MTEREVLLTGIGGQGVQLAAQSLARAAAVEGKRVSLFGVYGGMMRGGNSDSTIVVADGPILAPPLVSHAWSAIVLHHKFWPPLAGRMRPGGVLVVNSSLFEGELDRDQLRVFEVPATDLATELGNAMAASMVIAGAYASITGLVGLAALVDGMAQSVPPYRRQHVDTNTAALTAGFEAGPRLVAPAWKLLAADKALVP